MVEVTLERSDTQTIRSYGESTVRDQPSAEHQMMMN